MVKFIMTMDGFDVLVDNKIFGRLKKGIGFITSPTTLNDYLEVCPDDLEMIALKAGEAKIHGYLIPFCESCDGTPKFPKMIYNPNEGMVLCCASIHKERE